MIGGDVRVRVGEFWTVSDLQIVVWRWYGVRYETVTSYQRLLHECGFSYQKTEKIYRSRPNVQEVADFEADLEKNHGLFARPSQWGHPGNR